MRITSTNKNKEFYPEVLEDMTEELPEHETDITNIIEEK